MSAARDRAHLFSGRHLAFTILVGVVMSGLTGGLLVVASASRDGSDVSQASDLLLGVSHVGDRWSYRIESPHLDDRHLLISLMAPEVVRDAAGLEVATVPVRYEWLDAAAPIVVERIDPRGHVVSRATSQRTWHGDPSALGPASTETVVRHENFTRPGEVLLPDCLVRHGLQGVAIETTASLRPFDGCRSPQESMPLGGTFEPGGSAWIDGHEIAQFRALDGGIRMALAPGIPYLVRLESGPEDAPTLRYTLMGFSAGTGSTLGLPSAAGSPLPAFGASSGDHGLIDSAGLDHPFPMTRAFDLAQNDPYDHRVRSFLDAHPTASLSYASYDDQGTVAQRRHQWAMILSERGANQTFCVTLENTDAVLPEVAMQPPQGPFAAPAANGPNPDRLDQRLNAHACSWWTPRPLDVTGPARLAPSLAQLRLRWAEYNPGTSEQALAYGLEYACMDVPCMERGYTYEIGNVNRESHPVPQKDGAVESNVRSDLLTFDESGAARSFRSYRSEHVWQPLDAAAWRPAAPAPASATPVKWQPPLARGAAQVGFAAAVAALAFWIWPAVRHGAWGLLHRSKEPLGHPMRQRIHQLVGAEPGLHFQAIMRRLGVKRSSLGHHLKVLHDAGLIVEQVSPGFTCYFRKGDVDRRVMAGAPALKSAGSRRVLETLCQVPRSTLGEVARLSGFAPATVHYHAHRLVAAGLVEVEREGGAMFLKPSSVAQSALALPAAPTTETPTP